MTRTNLSNLGKYAHPVKATKAPRFGLPKATPTLTPRLPRGTGPGNKTVVPPPTWTRARKSK